MTNTPTYRMPAEWESHRATWVAWPHLESDFPGKVDAVRWAFCELIRHLSRGEPVEILCAGEEILKDCELRLGRQKIMGEIRKHLVPYERTWLRDSAPTGVSCEGKMSWIAWQFNAWARYENFGPDQDIPEFIAKTTGRELLAAERPDVGTPLVLEGGAIDVDGQGTVLVTEQCLLSNVQERNPGLTKEGYETAFKRYLGASNTLWLPGGCEGDDTHGHIDDVARFVGPGRVVVASAARSDHEQYVSCQENIACLKRAVDGQGRKLDVIELPFPDPIYCDGVRLPASYLNFYIGNEAVLVPTFNDVQDRRVLRIFADLFPRRRVVGIHCGDWVLGYGSLHCSTQQEPA